MEILVDPVVSKTKFDREVAQYRELEDEYIRQGWFLLKAEFPMVFVVFAAPQLQPPGIVFGAELDFTNYDLWAPSVRLVHPFTRLPYKGKELPTRFLRGPSPEVLANLMGQGAIQFEAQPLMQFHDPEEVPFLCLPGVREYHQHPAHTGDSWLLHRGRGEGTLHFLLDKLYRYGVQPIGGYGYQLKFTGYSLKGLPQ